jgi:hypothetical protein
MPEQFEPEKAPARSAGAHPAVSSTPSTGQEDILKLFRSGNNKDLDKAVAMATDLNKKGLLKEDVAKELGFF